MTESESSPGDIDEHIRWLSSVGGPASGKRLNSNWDADEIYPNSKTGTEFLGEVWKVLDTSDNLYIGELLLRHLPLQSDTLKLIRC